MPRLAPTSAALTVLLALSGCGAESQSSDEGSQTSAAAAGAREKAAATQAVHEWVDKDDCTLMSDRFAAEGAASVAEGRKACQQDLDPGLRAGEYTIKSVAITGDRGTAVLALNSGGTRTYGLIRGGKYGWQIDSIAERFVGNVGDTFTLRDSYVQDGTAVNVKLEATVLQVKTNVKPDSPYTPTGPGNKWVRVKIRLHSLSDADYSQSTSDFKLVDTAGHRYDPDGSVFQPSLGNGGVSLAQGDKVLGYQGYQVPKGAAVKAVRLQPVGGIGAPIVWKLRR